jgi:hypothetical protein
MSFQDSWYDDTDPVFTDLNAFSMPEENGSGNYKKLQSKQQATSPEITIGNNGSRVKLKIKSKSKAIDGKKKSSLPKTNHKKRRMEEEDESEDKSADISLFWDLFIDNKPIHMEKELLPEIELFNLDGRRKSFFEIRNIIQVYNYLFL